jgi:calcineurin-like phosphoesterase family protein
MFGELDMDFDGNKFHLTHAPACIPEHVREDKDVWTIHGHSQNRNLDKHQFIDRDARTINVSTDVTNFRPVALDDILNIMKTEPRITADDLAISARTKLFRERVEVTVSV